MLLVVLLVAGVWIYGERERRREEEELRTADKAGLYRQLLPVVEPPSPSSSSRTPLSPLSPSPATPSPSPSTHRYRTSIASPVVVRSPIVGSPTDPFTSARATDIDVTSSPSRRGPPLPPPPPAAAPHIPGEDRGYRQRRHKPLSARVGLSSGLPLAICTSTAAHVNTRHPFHQPSSVHPHFRDSLSDCSHRHRRRRKTWFDPEYKMTWNFRRGMKEEEIEWMDELDRRASA